MADEGVKTYEVAALLKEEDVSPVLKVLSRHGARPQNDFKLVKVRLSYPIKKETQAFFSYLHFEALPLIPAKVSEDLKLLPQVLRHLIVKIPFDKSRKTTGDAPPPPKIERKAGALTNEELEKKIEEIRV